jgi:hypothetical protein
MNVARVAGRLAFRANPPIDPPSCLTRDKRGAKPTNDFCTNMYIVMASNAALLLPYDGLESWTFLDIQ